MIPYLLDTSYTLKTEFSDFISFIWTTRYYDTGDFELVVPITEKALTYVKAGYYIVRDDDENIGIIEKIELITAEDEADRMIITGKLGDCILGRRIIASRQSFKNKTVGQIVDGLISSQITLPTIAARKITDFVYSDDTTLATTLSRQYTGDNLEEAIQELCQTYGLGYKVIFNRTTSKFECHLYEGSDRSYAQNTLPYVVFSTSYSNLTNADYIEDYSGLITDVLVAGEGQGSSRVTQWAHETVNSGLNRYEAYEDAREISSESLTTLEYKAQLEAQGLEAITHILTALGGEVVLNNYEYGQDFYLGDIVRVEVPAWNLGTNARIIEVIESISELGVHTIIPTFGT